MNLKGGAQVTARAVGRAPVLGGAQQGSNCAKTFNRFLNVHEYQGAKQMAGFGINVPPGIPAFTVQEAVDAAKKMDGGSGEVRRHSLSFPQSLSGGGLRRDEGGKGRSSCRDQLPSSRILTLTRPLRPLANLFPLDARRSW